MNRFQRPLVERVLVERQQEFNDEHHKQVLRQIKVLGMMEDLNIMDNVVIGPWLRPDEAS